MAHDQLPIGRDIVGHSYLIGAYEVVIVDLVTAADDTRLPAGSIEDGFPPEYHIQLRVAPTGS